MLPNISICKETLSPHPSSSLPSPSLVTPCSQASRAEEERGVAQLGVVLEVALDLRAQSHHLLLHLGLVGGGHPDDTPPLLESGVRRAPVGRDATAAAPHCCCRRLRQRPRVLGEGLLLRLVHARRLLLLLLLLVRLLLRLLVLLHGGLLVRHLRLCRRVHLGLRRLRVAVAVVRGLLRLLVHLLRRRLLLLRVLVRLLVLRGRRARVLLVLLGWELGEHVGRRLAVLLLLQPRWALAQ
mmetsp:Transcript_57289/g.134512  ORF Transcript_57289/g.134512 Transcript_57289/m.134512 type:complete len:239 (+) Transcript_57289:30-746(+)